MGRRAWTLLLLCGCVCFGFLVFFHTYINDASKWVVYPTNGHLYTQGRFIGSGAVYDRDGVVLSAVEDGKRVFNGSAGVRKAVMHLVGDSGGNVSTGIQTVYADKLAGWNPVTGVYASDHLNSGVTTTVDAGLCRTAYEALSGRSGTVAVMNYKTGDILCMVSGPSFDPADPPDIAKAPEKYDGVYLNRFLSATYTPGSVFKLVTTAAALDTIGGVETRTFHCSGSAAYAGGEVTCPKTHGEQSFEMALVNSCNVAYGELAVELGPGVLTRYAEKVGYNSQSRLDAVRTAAGIFDVSEANEAELAWSGVGQYTTLTNPYRFLTFVAAVANGGVETEGHIVQSATRDAVALFSPGRRILSEETAQAMKAMMRQTVVKSYGDGGLSGYNFCGKTGTAEVGGGKENHAWFTGFLDSEEAPYAVIVVVEHGGAGSKAALGAARTVLEAAVKLEP
ncbi:penicillin-binding protein [Oscillospiraceae bacterium OttesenSCG-928-F05]|nr:penicillin-binding protein [Oscillospiraceae bacterium OttesenSCG-928-F05]